MERDVDRVLSGASFFYRLEKAVRLARKDIHQILKRLPISSDAREHFVSDVCKQIGHLLCIGGRRALVNPHNQVSQADNLRELTINQIVAKGVRLDPMESA